MPNSSRQVVFIAGASGAIGRVLCQLLIDDGWRVVGSTRYPAKADELRAFGVEPVIVDAFDRETLIRVVGDAKPDVLVHQLTDLPKTYDPAIMPAARVRNAHLREVGTDNLVAAAALAGVRRLVAQSIAFAYAPGPLPHAEAAPLDLATASAVATLEELVLGGPFEGVVLRYGHLYGPHAWTDVAPGKCPLHVDAAADAARRAVTRGRPGVYNIAEDDGTLTIAKAQAELGWSPAFHVGRRGEG